MLAQLRDRERWPKLPERKLAPLTSQELAALALTDSDLRRMFWRPDAGKVAGGGKAEVRG